MDKNKNIAVIATSVFFEQSFVIQVINVCVYLISTENSQPKLALLSLREFSRYSLSKRAVFPASNGRYFHFVTSIV